MKERCRGRNGQPRKPQGTGIPEHTIINLKGGKKPPRNSNIALHSITHTYRMERLPGIEPKYKRNGLPYSYHINKDTKEKIASGLKVTIRQKQKTPAPACHRRRGFLFFHRGLCRLTDLFPQRFCHLLIFLLREKHFLHIIMERLSPLKSALVFGNHVYMYMGHAVPKSA